MPPVDVSPLSTRLASALTGTIDATHEKTGIVFRVVLIDPSALAEWHAAAVALERRVDEMSEAGLGLAARCANAETEVEMLRVVLARYEGDGGAD